MKWCFLKTKNEKIKKTKKMEIKSSQIRRDFLCASKTVTNGIWASISLVGGSVFSLLGICSYFQTDLFLVFKGTEIQFFPQGVLLVFYGVSAILLSFYLWSIYFWCIGDGYNEFNLTSSTLRIFRWGFPGKNRKICISYPLSEIENLTLSNDQGFNSQSTLYLDLKNKSSIPLTRVDSDLSLKEFEYYAADLAKFLKVGLKEKS